MILDSNKSFLLILVFSALIVGIITIYCAVNHQQKIDNQIVSGTIHMLNTTNDGVEPSFKENYTKNKTKVGRFDYVHNALSNNPNFLEWNNMAKYIYDRYYDYNAFIIIVNNDILLYTSIALSFIIEGLDKPIIFTNGDNVFASLLSASQTKIPEVMIYSNNKLFRAVKSIYYGFNNFSSPNYYPLTNTNCLQIQKEQYPSLKYINNFNIPIIKVFPGIENNYLSSVLNTNNIHGIIIEMKGNSLSLINKDILQTIKNITSKGVVIVCVAENSSNTLNNIDIRLVNAGCLDAGNSTTETAYIKLAFLLSQSPERKLIGKLMEINFRGEIDIY
jgi:L-asparaginase